jgi:hypothetical protein
MKTALLDYEIIAEEFPDFRLEESDFCPEESLPWQGLDNGLGDSEGGIA